MSEDVKTPDEADFQAWSRALALKIAAVQADMNYAAATTFCSDCPRRENRETSRYECCKDNGDLAEMYEADFEFIDKLITAQKALKALLEDES